MNRVIKYLFALFLTVLAMQNTFAAVSIHQDLRVNEIVVSTPSTDYEFVEFYSDTGASLDNISFVSLRPDGRVYRRLDLAGSIAENGYFLAANPTAEAQYSITPDIAFANNYLKPLHESANKAAVLIK